MHIKSTLKLFSELTIAGRIWEDSNINPAVQTSIDVRQFVCLEMRNYRGWNLPALVPVIYIEDIYSPANYPRLWLGQIDTWRVL